MPITTFYTVTIEFAGAGNRPESHEDHVPLGCDIRLVESRTAPQRQFTLHGRGRPAHNLPPHPGYEWTEPLTDEESDHLMSLLAQMKVAYSPPRMAGFDGNWCILNIVGGQENMRFAWWVYVPEGWESVAAVFDYAVALARRSYLASAGA